MKKIAAIILIICLSLSTTSYASYELLSRADILSGSFSSFNNDDKVTRKDFAVAISQLMNLSDSLSAYSGNFTDVDEKTSGCKEIGTLSEMKIISGFADGSFRPSKNILCAEAVKVIINILGYDYKAKASGGYPTGYLAVANELRLLSGITRSYYDELTFGELMRIFENALNIPVSEISGTDGEGNFTYTIRKDYTLGVKYHNVKKSEGILTATPYVALSGSAISPDGYIAAEGINLICDETEIYSLIGRRTEFIYRIDEKTGENILLGMWETDGNKINVIDIDAYEGYSDGKLYYSEENGKQRSINISPVADVIVNGENGELNGAFLSSVEMGDITVVSAGERQTVIINSYKDMTVSRVDMNGKRIYSPEGKCLDLSATDGTVRIFDGDGNIAGFGFITIDDVITYSEGERLVTVYAASESISGKIDSVANEDKGLYITIGDKTLRVSPSSEKAFATVKPGYNVRVAVNKFGFAANLRILSRDGLEYAYLLKAAEKGINTPEKNILVKLFTVNGEIRNLKLHERINVNGDSEAVKNISDFTNMFPGGTETIIGYKTNEEGDILTHLVIPEALGTLEEERRDGLCMTHPLAKRYLYENPLKLAMTLPLSASTPVIVIPDNISLCDDDDFSILTANYLAEGEEINTEAYSASVDYTIPDFIVYRPAAGSAAAPPFKYETSLVTVKAITGAVNEDGERVTKYTVQNGYSEKTFFYDGSEVTDTTSDTRTAYSLKDVEVGDIIRYSADNDGFIRLLEVHYDSSKNEWMYDTAQISRGRGYIKTNVAKVVGSVLYVPAWKGNEPDYYSVVDLSEKTLSIGGVTVITRRDGRAPIVSPGTIADVLKNDEIIVHVAYGQLLGIILFK